MSCSSTSAVTSAAFASSHFLDVVLSNSPYPYIYSENYPPCSNSYSYDPDNVLYNPYTLFNYSSKPAINSFALATWLSKPATYPLVLSSSAYNCCFSFTNTATYSESSEHCTACTSTALESSSASYSAASRSAAFSFARDSAISHCAAKLCSACLASLCAVRACASCAYKAS